MKQTRVMKPKTSAIPLQHGISGNVAPLIQGTAQPKPSEVPQAVPSLLTCVSPESAKEVAEVKCAARKSTFPSCSCCNTPGDHSVISLDSLDLTGKLFGLKKCFISLF